MKRCYKCKRTDAEVELFKTYGTSYICYECQTDTRLQKRYGLSLDEYNLIFKQQDGVCAICGNPPNEKMLGVDHCHETKKVRGLLCDKCNLALGLLKDSPEIVTNLLAYLNFHSLEGVPV